ncbi:hypothetical protein CR513_06990, partial [Mucuna pruriens]
MGVGRNVSALINNEQVSTLIQPAMPKKCSDPNTFSIPRTRAIYRSLTHCAFELTGIVIQLANKSITHLLGIFKDMLVQVSDMIFLADFYVLSMKDELSSKRPTLILSRPFLKIARTKIDVHVG